ncbi:MAG: DUF485 domain-containing protein [Rhodocyclaceae bacterium]|nr:DUF485 domain-containing protein [Rhodocyclaceae bacterium]
MNEEAVRRMKENPRYQELVSTRSRFGWILTAIMMVVYYGYIMIIAFDKELLAIKLGDGVMTLGIPVGIGIIIFTVILTGIYVRRANSEFDEMTEELVKEVK